jgi:hypothetical protein
MTQTRILSYVPATITGSEVSYAFIAANQDAQIDFITVLLLSPQVYYFP